MLVPQLKIKSAGEISPALFIWSFILCRFRQAELAEERI